MNIFKTNLAYLLVPFSIMLMGCFLWVAGMGCGYAVPENDVCDVGQEYIRESSLSNFDCESLSGCTWRALGGEVEMFYACCPLDLTMEMDSDHLYDRCFVLID